MLNGRVQVTVFYDRVVSSADDAPATDEVEAVTRVPFNLREIWDTPPASLLDLQPRPRTIAGLLVLDLVVQPVPVTLAVFKCTW